MLCLKEIQSNKPKTSLHLVLRIRRTLKQMIIRSHHTSPHPKNPTPLPSKLNYTPSSHFLFNYPQTHTTHRRNLATPMDPTGKKQPKFTSSTTKPHPTHPDPSLDSCSTIQNISNHFSKLQTQHKALVASLKPSTDKPIPDTSLVKSSRQHRRKTATKSLNQSHEADDIKRALANIKTDGLKKSRSMKEREKNPSMGLMSPNQESELMEPFHGGCETKRSSVLLTKGYGYGRRRSFCSSQTELADFLSCSGVKVVSSDMPPFMQIHAVDFARKACDSLEKFTARTLASSLKKEFDGIYGPAWHCIVGTSFGSFVTHSVGGFLYFSMDHKMYVLLFKTTVQKAD